MAGKSLNKVLLIGNLTKDPDLRYTATGTAVCTLGLATNRSWVTETGEKRDEVEYHRLVAWRKLAEICGQYLVKGKKIYVEGHLLTRKYTAQDGQEKSVTEIVMDDLIMLDGKRAGEDEIGGTKYSTPSVQQKTSVAGTSTQLADRQGAEDTATVVSPDDIPF